MFTLQLFDANGEPRDIEKEIQAIPNRIYRQYDMASGVCVVYQEGDEIPKPSAQALLDSAKSAAFEQLRQRKWQAKDAGITVNGIAIDTDDKGQATINGAVTNVLIDPAFKANWKTAATGENGGAIWVKLDGVTIIALAKALTAYTEACFAVEAQKQAELAALQTADAITAWLETALDAGWPARAVSL